MSERSVWQTTDVVWFAGEVTGGPGVCDLGPPVAPEVVPSAADLAGWGDTTSAEGLTAGVVATVVGAGLD